MTSSPINAESLLAIDVGTTNTRAVLFDVVEGHYRFIGSGTALTTAGAPFKDIGEGIRLALDQLQNITGHTFVGKDEHLIIPSLSDGSGVDACVATLSAGPPLRVVAVGLLEDVSVDSAQNLASMIYAQVVDTLSLNDRRQPSTRLDTLLRIRPDLIIVAGGTEGGASHSLMTLIESIGLACYITPEIVRPDVLYVGNQALIPEIKASLGSYATLHIAPNIRPTLEMEQLSSAQDDLAMIFRQVRGKKIPGVQELNDWTGGQLMPTVTAFGKLVRFLSRVYDPAKGVLGIDVGSSATSIAAAFSGDLILRVYPKFGLGECLAGLLNYTLLEEITRWLSVEVTDAEVRDYLFNKAVHPSSIPANAEELSIEQAVARQVMQLAVKKVMKNFPRRAARSGVGLLPWFEPILATGNVLTNAPTRGQTLLMLLDALQPTGVTTFALDQNMISSALGAAAAVNPALTVQVLESGSFLNLGTVISPVGNANYGTSCLRVRVTYETGNTANLDIKFGALEVIQMPIGQNANLHLQPLHRFDVGMGGPGRGGNVKVVGGSLGVIIDTRGRPLRLPDDPVRRRELNKKWIWTFGG